MTSLPAQLGAIVELANSVQHGGMPAVSPGPQTLRKPPSRNACDAPVVPDVPLVLVAALPVEVPLVDELADELAPPEQAESSPIIEIAQSADETELPLASDVSTSLSMKTPS
ncbi:MAG: hypothetical protein JST54_26160 [Deltaproteobacteria bacterium]|nr:hypothetical protein [Deltaproteobacteria bacterium]